MLKLRIKRTNVYETNWDPIDRFQREIVDKEEEKAATETYDGVQKHLTALLCQIHRLHDTLMCLFDTTGESLKKMKARFGKGTGLAATTNGMGGSRGKHMYIKIIQGLTNNNTHAHMHKENIYRHIY